jgi:hypothetical protein
MGKFLKVILVFLFIGIGYLFVRGSDYRSEIEQYPGQTICKYTFCKSVGKSRIAFVKYYVDNKVYRNSVGRCPSNSELKMNKYYRLKYSTKDPNKILVYFSEEVTDSILIKELASKLEFKYWLDH